MVSRACRGWRRCRCKPLDHCRGNARISVRAIGPHLACKLLRSRRPISDELRGNVQLRGSSAGGHQDGVGVNIDNVFYVVGVATGHHNR